MADEPALESGIESGATPPSSLLDEETDGDAVNLQIDGEEELLPTEEIQAEAVVTSTSEPPSGGDTLDLDEKREEGSEEQKSEEDDISELPGRTGVNLRRYVNERGNFITGVDVTSEEAAAKRLQRAQRFGLSRTQPENFDKLHERGKRFGVQTPVVDGELIKAVKQLPESKDGDLRPEAIYLYGTDEMNTKDVFQYFGEYGPSCVEWIDDSSCNVVWDDPTSTSRALVGKGKNPVVTESEREKLFSTTPDATATSDLNQSTWRLGDSHPRSKQLLLRYANTQDVKEEGAAGRSQFYQKYGNPNQSQEQGRKRSRRKKSKGDDLRNRIKSRRAAAGGAAGGDDGDHMTSTGEKESSQEEEEEEEGDKMETGEDQPSLSLMSQSKRSKTMYSDQGKKGGGISERVGAKKTWRDTEPVTNTASPGSDLRQKLIAKRKRTSLTIQLDDGSRQVSMDTS